MIEVPAWVTYVVPIVATLIAWGCKTRLSASVLTQVRIAIEAVLTELNRSGVIESATPSAVANEAVRRVEAATGTYVTEAIERTATRVAAEKLDTMREM